MTTSEPFHQSVANYYTAKLESHGPNPGGVDWNSGESQDIRFDQLLRVIQPGRKFTLNDFGCGYGALIAKLETQSWSFDYVGFDISSAMVGEARRLHSGKPNCRFADDPTCLSAADYTVASGIFNVKLDADNQGWTQYILRTLDQINDLSSIGFAFNVLTSYSEVEKMRPGLFYADPCWLFDHCKRRYSRNVALLHDYGLYEFTLIVRKT